MCGIAGIYDIRGVSLNTITSVSGVLRHRGPDDEGFLFIDSDNLVKSLRGDDTITELSCLTPFSAYSGSPKLAFIHRRLSIIDLKPTGHQPMCLADNRFAIIYNGEVYNYIELRTELQKLGYSFFSDSDTEVILNSYRHWSEKCVDHFVGMWAFVILDRTKNILFCSRDRFGIKPFYYFENPDFFAFGSEIKALLALPQVQPILDENKAIEFLTNGNQNFNGKTFFSGISELLPAHNMIYDLLSQTLSSYSYYSIKLSDSLINISHDEAIKKMSELINDAISIHLRSDVPVGTCLSGGLDSTTIIAHVAGIKLPYKVCTFTASFPGTNVDETSYINQLKGLYDFSDYYTYPDLKKLWSVADPFLWHQELPVQSTSMFAQWEVMKLAHDNLIKVLLDGQGMDEILGGYSEFTGSLLLGHLTNGRFLKFFKAYIDLKTNYKTSPVLNELARAMFQYIPEALRHRIYSSQRVGPSIINKKYSDILQEIKFERRISNSMRETSLMSIQNILPVLLRYEDRSSMAFSIESRVPYLDHRLVEFCVNLPDDVKIHNGWTKYVLRKSSEPYLPKEITWRKEKFGFVTPEKLWAVELEKGLTEFVQNNNIPKIINPEKLLGIIRSGTNDKINLGEIWKVILFIKWYNIFNLKSQ
jgi:asparagine synthase (glutamine-hydrolysing)